MSKIITLKILEIINNLELLEIRDTIVKLFV